MRSPRSNDFFLENVGLVEGHEDLRNVRLNELRISFSDVSFDTTQEGLLMLLGGGELGFENEDEGLAASCGKGRV